VNEYALASENNYDVGKHVNKNLNILNIYWKIIILLPIRDLLSSNTFTPLNVSNSFRWGLTKPISNRASICVQKYTFKKTQTPKRSMLITLSRQMMSVDSLITREHLPRATPLMLVKIQSLLATI
jgi:hypothetical protein